jgi:hypothetical protein
MAILNLRSYKNTHRPSLEQAAMDSVDVAMEYFKKNGIELSRTPTVDLLEIDNYSGSAHANIGLEKEVLLSAHEISAYLTHLFRRNLRLDISSEALQEPSEQIARKSYVFDLPTKCDITIFPRIRDSRSCLDGIMAHEIWHLIEAEKGLLNKPTLIMEGTAQYAQLLFSGGQFEWYDNSSRRNDSVYWNIASIAREVLKGKKNPLQALFDQGIRTEIEKRTRINVLPTLLRNVAEKADSYDRIQNPLAWFYDLKEMDCFKQDPCRKGFLKSLRKAKWKKMYKQLKNQDLRHAIHYHTTAIDRPYKVACSNLQSQ